MKHVLLFPHTLLPSCLYTTVLWLLHDGSLLTDPSFSRSKLGVG